MVTKEQLIRTCEEAIGEELCLLFYDPIIAPAHALAMRIQREKVLLDSLTKEDSNVLSSVNKCIEQLLDARSKSRLARRVLERISKKHNYNFQAAYDAIVAETHKQRRDKEMIHESTGMTQKDYTLFYGEEPDYLKESEDTDHAEGG